MKKYYSVVCCTDHCSTDSLVKVYEDYRTCETKSAAKMQYFQSRIKHGFDVHSTIKRQADPDIKCIKLSSASLPPHRLAAVSPSTQSQAFQNDFILFDLFHVVSPLKLGECYRKS